MLPIPMSVNGSSFGLEWGKTLERSGRDCAGMLSVVRGPAPC